MERAHDGMTIHQRRVLQFQLEALGLEDDYVELNGEMPLDACGWEPEVDGLASEPRADAIGGPVPGAGHRPVGLR